MPVNRYPLATFQEQVKPAALGVLSVKIKVQTAQKWGMIIWEHPDTPVITSGVPICSVVGARDHLGRYIDVSSLTTLVGKVRDQAPVEQSTCNRGQCMMPSLERVHAYTLATSLVQDKTPISDAQRNVDFPPYVPEDYNKMRGTRVHDQSLVTPDIKYCDFKGFQVMKYATLKAHAVGSKDPPRWEVLGEGKGIPARTRISPDPATAAKRKRKRRKRAVIVSVSD